MKAIAYVNVVCKGNSFRLLSAVSFTNVGLRLFQYIRYQSKRPALPPMASQSPHSSPLIRLRPLRFIVEYSSVTSLALVCVAGSVHVFDTVSALCKAACRFGGVLRILVR